MGLGCVTAPSTSRGNPHISTLRISTAMGLSTPGGVNHRSRTGEETILDRYVALGLHCVQNTRAMNLSRSRVTNGAIPLAPERRSNSPRPTFIASSLGSRFARGQYTDSACPRERRRPLSEHRKQ